MKSVLISIHPKWCLLIASEKKTVEVRKTRPKIDTPFKCYIYETQAIYKPDGSNYFFNGVGKVIGEFVCDAIITDKTFGHNALFKASACMSDADISAYCLNEEMYCWHISDLVIYDELKELSDFVVEGDCSCENCGKCKWFDKGNGYNVEDDCLLSYEYGFKTVKPLFRPPQSWCYVEAHPTEKGGVE